MCLFVYPYVFVCCLLFHLSSLVRMQAFPHTFLQANSRYDGQVVVFGSELQQKIAECKYFLVCVLPLSFSTPFLLASFLLHKYLIIITAL